MVLIFHALQYELRKTATQRTNEGVVPNVVGSQRTALPVRFERTAVGLLPVCAEDRESQATSKLRTEIRHADQS
eukprot:472830-Amphidinium_carterae.1